MNIEKIFVIHYHKAIDRKAYLDLHLPKLNIPFEYRCSIDRDSPEIEQLKYFDCSTENKDKRNQILQRYGLFVPGGLNIDTGTNIDLKYKAVRAATLEHFKTYEYIYNETNLNNILILEDDVCFKDQFFNDFKLLQENIPDDYDVCYIGSCCDLQPPSPSESVFERHPTHQSRCSDSYILNRNSIKKIIDNMLPFFTAIDWDLNYVQQLLNMNVYWATNPQIYQGSQQGNYKSLLG